MRLHLSSGPRALALGALGLLAAVALIARPAPARSASSAAGLAAIGISPRYARANPGDVFTVTVAIAAPQRPLQGADVSLDFDPAYLRVVDASGQPASAVEIGPSFPVALRNHVDNGAGRIECAAGVALGSPAASGNLVFATVRLQCLAPLPAGGTPLSFGFDRSGNRVTELAYRGQSVLGAHADGAVYRYPQPVRLPLVLR